MAKRKSVRKREKPIFIEEPFGLPVELRPVGKFRTDIYIDKRGFVRKIKKVM